MKNNQTNSADVKNENTNETINFDFEYGFLNYKKPFKHEVQIKNLDKKLREGGTIENFSLKTLENYIEIYQNKKDDKGKEYNEELLILYYYFLKKGIDILNKELKFDFREYLETCDGYNPTTEMKEMDLTKIDEKALMCMTGSLIFCYDDYENNKDIYRLELKRRGIIETKEDGEDVWKKDIDDSYTFILGDGSYFNELEEVMTAIKETQTKKE